MNNSATPAEARALLRLPLDLIDADDRLRPVDPEKVAEVRASMADQGLLTPIEVRPHPEAEGRWLLVFGGHRLQGARDLAWEAIDAVAFHGSDDEARLREIDENLYRHELNPLDQAVFLAERQAIYERLNPETRHGGDRRSIKRQTLPHDQPRTFAEDVSAKVGLAPRTVRLALQRAAELHPEAIGLIRGTALARKGSTLDALRGVAKNRQADVVRAMLAEGDPERPRTVAEARQRVLKEKPAAPAAAKSPLVKAQQAFNHLGAEDQRAFVSWLRSQGHLRRAEVAS